MRRIILYSKYEGENIVATVREYEKDGVVVKSEGSRPETEDWRLSAVKYTGARRAYKARMGNNVPAEFLGSEIAGPYVPFPEIVVKLDENNVMSWGEIAPTEEKEKRVRHDHTTDSLKAMCETVKASGKTLREYLIETDQLSEMPSIYQKAKKEGIEFPMGKRGRQKKVLQVA